MRSGFPFFINSVEYSTEAAGPEFIRINAWPGFLQRDIVEVAVARPQQQVMVKEFFDKLGWNYQLVPDIPGMITARIVASIINEAYFTFGDGTSTKKEIDIAMKLGTSYPYGPFEWSEKIGLGHIYSLLIELANREKRYSVAPALEKEIRLLEKK
jgi:3-hydroxybutyryl-CoA dehydrogenase